MNIQTMLNLILKMSKQLENTPMQNYTKLKEVPLIPLKTFKELLPESFIDHINNELTKIGIQD